MIAAFQITLIVWRVSFKTIRRFRMAWSAYI
jgi:hypothetical protein